MVMGIAKQERLDRLNRMSENDLMDECEKLKEEYTKFDNVYKNKCSIFAIMEKMNVTTDRGIAMVAASAAQRGATMEMWHEARNVLYAKRNAKRRTAKKKTVK